MRSLIISRDSWWLRAFCWLWDVHWSNLNSCHLIWGTLFWPLAFFCRPGQGKRRAVYRVSLLVLLTPLVISFALMLVYLGWRDNLEKNRLIGLIYYWLSAYQIVVFYGLTLYYQLRCRWHSNPEEAFFEWFDYLSPLGKCLAVLGMFPGVIAASLVLGIFFGFGGLVAKGAVVLYHLIDRRRPGYSHRESQRGLRAIGVVPPRPPGVHRSATHSFFSILWESAIAFKHYTCRKIEVV